MRWGERSDARAIITQTADPLFRDLDLSWFPDLALLFDALGNDLFVGNPTYGYLGGSGFLNLVAGFLTPDAGEINYTEH